MPIDRIRLNKYRDLYVGPQVSDPRLNRRRQNDATTMSYIRTPPATYGIANFQKNAPRNFHMPVGRHMQPVDHLQNHNHITRELRQKMSSRGYTQGSSQFNQATVRAIAELSRLVR